MSSLCACGQNAIVKRWKAVGRQVNGEISTDGLRTKEYEFLSNGHFNIYENGALIDNGVYILAGDRKSVLFKTDGKSQSVKIAKLTANELRMVIGSPFSSGDTVVCYPSGGGAAKKSQQKKEDRDLMAQTWSSMHINDRKLAQKISIVVSILESKDKGNKIYSQWLETEQEIEKPRQWPDIPDVNALREYSTLQGNLYKCANDILQHLNTKFPGLRENEVFSEKTYSVYDYLQKDFLHAQNVKANFDEAYKNYTQQ
jgi:hypothetical protein